MGAEVATCATCVCGERLDPLGDQWSRFVVWARDRTPCSSQRSERSNSSSVCCRWRLRDSRTSRPRFEYREAPGWGDDSSFFARSGHGVGCDSLTRALPRMSRNARKRPQRRIHSLKPARTSSTRSSGTESSFALSVSRRSVRSDQVHARSPMMWLFASERGACVVRFT